MAAPWTPTLLCGLLAATLVQATFNSPAVLNLGPEVIKERLTWKLKEHNATVILQQLPLLSTIKDSSRGLLSGLVDAFIKQIIWMKITSAAIPQLQVQPSGQDQELLITIPLDMVAGFNTPLVKTLVELQMQSEVEALIRVESRQTGPPGLILGDCFNSQGSLRISLLQKLSIFVSPLVDKITSLLMPALPKLVKTQLCPVVQAAFEDMYADFLRLVRAPIPLSSGVLLLDLLSPAIEDSVIQLNLQATLLDSQSKVTKLLNASSTSLTMPALDGAPFSFLARQDVLNAVVALLLPPDTLMVMLDYVLPELASELKSGIKEINEQAVEKLDRTELVKFRTLKSPQLLLSQGSAQASQLIVFDLFPTNRAQRALFTLGIEAKSEAQFYMEGDRLVLSFSDISTERIKMMNSDMRVFNPALLKDIITKILNSALLPTQNGKLRTGVPMSLAEALGYQSVTPSLTKDALVLTPAAPYDLVLDSQ